ncbi:uncharacterized protein LOC100215086 [Hydra vulgaris]|uniref:uncharacterized protein LOC100215086 n=1 Tax=Hydra vulgaris TaxID=6087 RepID=UPI001F5F3859|nr:uncharacterized protein LOC100215086 [Hydra vulgaris]
MLTGGTMFAFSRLSARSFLLKSLVQKSNSRLCFGVVRNMSYTCQHHGSAYTSDYRLFLRNEAGLISPFHDIPLLVQGENNVYNMVVEIPRWTNAKMEICTKSKLNPIKQDTKNGAVRFIKNVFPYKGYPWNYGALPQTWEDPNLIDEHTNAFGDGDPVDVIEIGYKVAERGSVLQVKLLGVLAMIDNGETDWKVIAIDVNDPLASKLNDIDDVKEVMPGLLEATVEWFKIYKMPGGDPPNKFAFNGEAKHKEFATEIVLQTHSRWEELVTKKIENVKNIACENVTLESSPFKISHKDADAICALLPPRSACAPIPAEVDAMFYLSEKAKQSVVFGIVRNMSYTCQHHGSAYTSDYRLFLRNEIGVISPFHDIPLLVQGENNVYNMVVEIPRWTNAKMEICTKSKLNPIKQDTKNGVVRFVKNVFPYKGFPWNYGALPQTWQDPNLVDEHTNSFGDGDPVDIIEIGYKVAERGSVLQVKLLGVLAMVDYRETDWKVIAIDVNDPLASKLNDIDDVKEVMPGLLEATVEWFKIYKMPGGDPPNKFAFNGEAKHKEFATEIVLQTHCRWEELVTNKIKNVTNIACENVTLESSPFKISHKDADSICALLPPRSACSPIPAEVDAMFYLSEKAKQSQPNQPKPS